MSKIKKLSVLEARKIAAGEVVERPSNIVKELVENALDAGATIISVYIEDGGKKRVRVIDNGCGMAEEDARLCFEHHATSKIISIDDLDRLATFGFRGEALSSIAAISKVTLVTKEITAPVGIKITLEDGVPVKEEPIACQPGTDLDVRDIFYNVPVRQKFLKKTETEWRQILQMMHAYALANPTLHIKLYHDDALVLHCPPVQKGKERLTQVWGDALADQMLSCVTDDNYNYGKLQGFISNHQVAQFNKQKIFFFINRRSVKNNELSKALMKGYQHVLPDGRFPAAVLFLEIPAHELDVNIHPRKEEVRILYMQRIEQYIQQIVRKTLESSLSKQLHKAVTLQPAKALPFEQSIQLYATPLPVSTLYSQADDWFTGALQSPLHDPTSHAHFGAERVNQLREQVDVNNEKPNNLGAEVQQIESNLTNILMQQEVILKQQYQCVGHYKKTYILLEQEDGLLLIDQHAAHERILYELFSTRFQEVSQVKLLFPCILTLAAADLDLLEHYFPLLHRYGIETERFGPAQLIIHATPVYLKDISLDIFIKEFMQWVYEEHHDAMLESAMQSLTHKLCAQMACKAAVKAGDQLTKEQVEQLLNDLFICENRFSCPHGRPTGWLLNHEDIEKKFKRKF